MILLEQDHLCRPRKRALPVQAQAASVGIHSGSGRGPEHRRWGRAQLLPSGYPAL